MSLKKVIDQLAKQRELYIVAKKLYFLTHAPNGTLGDPSALAKLTKAILEQDPLIEIVFACVIEDEHKGAVEQLAPKDPRVKFYLAANIDNLLAPETLQSCDGILIYPTFHFLTEKDLATLKSFNKKMFVATEYDFDEKAQKKIIPLPHCITRLDTGLGTNKIGVFVNIDNQESQRGKISSLNDRDGGLKRLLLQGISDCSNTSYKQSHQLYFGYYNTANDEIEENQADPGIFTAICLQKFFDQLNSKKSPKTNLDIVVRLSEYIGRCKNKEELFEFFKKNDL